MIKKIEHIGIAVESLEVQKTFELILNKSFYKKEEVKSENVNVLFFRTGESKIELLEATDETSPVHKFIQKRGEGIHHIAFAVDNIHDEMKRLREAGFEFIYENPKQGADNQLINFVHPKYTHGVLIELCEDISDVQTKKQ